VDVLLAAAADSVAQADRCRPQAQAPAWTLQGHQPLWVAAAVLIRGCDSALSALVAGVLLARLVK
jgi:hypothetical protein